jgi:DNA-binding transcriptional MerR regulator
METNMPYIQMTFVELPMSTKEIANAFGCSVHTISRWRSLGLPCDKDKTRNQYYLSETKAWFKKMLEKKRVRRRGIRVEGVGV